MKPHQQHRQTSDVSGRVRQNAGSAALAAVLMLYFGFVHLTEPSGTGLFAHCNWLFYHTIRFGGVVMAVIALWSWIGHRPALIVDAVASAVIGILFILTGVGMLIDGGGAFQNLLFVIFGAMFIAAGVRNWREYFQLAAPTETASQEGADSYDPGFERRYQDARSAPSGPSLASRLLERADKTADTTASRGAPTPSKPQESCEPRASARADNERQCADQESATMPASSPAESGQDQASEETATPPPEGYLAQFAKENPPDKP